MSAAPAGRTQEERVKAFLDWLREVHGKDLVADGISVRVSEEFGLAVFALRRFEPGSALLSVPESAVLHAGKASATDFGKKVIAALKVLEPELQPDELLWLYMCWGREEPACPWFHYLQVLPAANPLAAHGDPEFLSWLRRTPLAESLPRELAEQRKRHGQLLTALRMAEPGGFSEARFGLDQWLWARGCVLSRAWRWNAFPEEYRVSGWESSVSLPAVDFTNHNGKAKVQLCFTSASAALELSCDAAAVEEGEQVFNSYGAAVTNEELISRYGFALERNSHDRIEELCFRAVPPPHLDLLQATLPAARARREGGTVRVSLSEGLRRKLDEVPVELLRISSLLVLGRDYDEETANCEDKRDAARSLAATLRAMASLRCAASRRRWRRDRSIRAVRAQHRKRKLAKASGPSAAAACYATGWRHVLRAVARLASGEADMAELTLQMEMNRSPASVQAGDESP